MFKPRGHQTKDCSLLDVVLPDRHSVHELDLIARSGLHPQVLITATAPRRPLDAPLQLVDGEGPLDGQRDDLPGRDPHEDLPSLLGKVNKNTQ